jgi:HPt (histidine-containing phosphotransfer) domain-containing protein
MRSQDNFRPSTKAEIETNMLAELETIMGGVSPEFLAELAPMFLQDIPPLLSTLETAVADDDLQSVVEAAHTLKGSSSSMGITRLAELAYIMEQQAKQGQTTRLPLSLAHLQAEYAQVVAVLQRYRRE